MCLIFAGCGSAKKIAGSKRETGNYTEATTAAKADSANFRIDTTKHSATKVTYTKTEFYPPESATEVDTTEMPESRPAEITAPANKPPKAGAIKSVETLTVESQAEEKGITESGSSTEEYQSTGITSEETLEEAVSEEPAADPHKWRYIFGILVSLMLISIAIYLINRKTGLLKKIILFFKRVF